MKLASVSDVPAWEESCRLAVEGEFANVGEEKASCHLLESRE